MPLRRATLRAYLDGLRSVALIPGATEHTYRAPLVIFLKAAAAELGFGSVDVHGELRMGETGQPDLRVSNADGVAIGYGETKTPGTAADFLSVLASEQIARYQRTLENLLVTDFLRFTLIQRDAGRADVQVVESPGRLATTRSVPTAQFELLATLLSRYFSAHAPAATTAEQLADGLARRATLLRLAIRALLEPTVADGDSLRTIFAFYRQTLMSDMKLDEFADTYAQTLVYALFLARLEGGPSKTLDEAWKAIPPDVPILRSAIQPLIGAGAVPDAMKPWLIDSVHVLASTPNAVIREIGHPTAGHPDPILYFYEHFLAAYDHAERIRRGVYYTPRPLVDYLVRAVDDSLRRDFGRGTGLADTGVTVLDPAVGTGTFLLAAAQVAVDTVGTTIGPGAIPMVLREHVVPHFIGFELLPAPYTIAHVKLALFARDHHVSAGGHRPRVYLTNTLGDPVSKASGVGMMRLFVPGLIDEAEQAEKVKTDERVLVVMGNPPYSKAGYNREPEIERLFQPWKTVDGKPIEEAIIALNDDYLKFFRWAVWKVLEQPGAPGHGIVAFVSNHGFINGRIHRGVRKALLDAFDEIWVFNLHGNQRLWVKGVVDEKVFPDVQQGIALTVLVRRSGEHAGRATVHHRGMRGTREEKYAAAAALRLDAPGWTEVEPTAPYYSFAPASGDIRYATWPSIPSIFPVGGSGTKTDRDALLSDVDSSALAARMRLFTDRSIDDVAIGERLGVADTPNWRLSKRRAAMVAYDDTRVVGWTYRLLDRRHVYWDTHLISRPGLNVATHLLRPPLGIGAAGKALVVDRSGSKPKRAICTVTVGIASSHTTSEWTHSYPLHLAPPLPGIGEVAALAADWTENLSPSIASALASAYGARPSVEDAAWYALAILSAPAYRERFSEALAIDHPRVPFPRDGATFESVRAIGERLGAAHLLEVDPPADIRYEGTGDDTIVRIRHDLATATVWINEGQRFTGVPVDAWGWGLGFRPLEHFLTDRKGRRLDMEQIGMFRRAVFAVREQIALGPQLDGLLAEVLAAPLDFDPGSIEPAPKAARPAPSIRLAAKRRTAAASTRRRPRPKAAVLDT